MGRAAGVIKCSSVGEDYTLMLGVNKCIYMGEWVLYWCWKLGNASQLETITDDGTERCYLRNDKIIGTTEHGFGKCISMGQDYTDVRVLGRHLHGTSSLVLELIRNAFAWHKTIGVEVKKCIAMREKYGIGVRNFISTWQDLVFELIKNAPPWDKGVVLELRNAPPWDKIKEWIYELCGARSIIVALINVSPWGKINRGRVRNALPRDYSVFELTIGW